MSVQIYLRKDIVEFLDYKLETIPPFNNIDYFDLSKATKFKYDINKFYWILDILTNPIPNGLNSKKQEFIPLCSKILINYIGKDYKEYLSYLTKNNIIKKSLRGFNSSDMNKAILCRAKTTPAKNAPVSKNNPI
mgnify:CR=1 FL=1